MLPIVSNRKGGGEMFLAIGVLSTLVALGFIGLVALRVYLLFSTVNRSGDQPQMLPSSHGRAVRFPVYRVGHAFSPLPSVAVAESPLPESIDVTPDGLDYRVWAQHHVPREQVLYVDRPYRSAREFLTIRVRNRSTVISVTMISPLAAEDLITELALYYPLTPKAWELVAYRYGPQDPRPMIVA